jgi:LuxR family transcriptional regulator, quorum-sensing system regulator BjaR1
MSATIQSLTDSVLNADSAQSASARFFIAAQAIGASYQQTRLYRRPRTALTSQSHWAAGGFVARYARPGWEGSEAFNYVCFTCNPLLAAIREGRTRYRFGEYAPHGRGEFGAYWDALGEAGIGEAVCATSYGPGGLIASLHLGFPQRDITSEEARELQLAGLMLTERLIDLAEPEVEEGPHLTLREHDVLRLVADGKTDWEISVILGVSEATARFHVDNARRKLGAVTRAQAVACMAVRRLI